jgi:hypothetical protein
MDRWHPSLSVTSWALGSSVEIKSEHTMQFTLSGIMLENLLLTYSLFYRMDDSVEREEVPDILICNALGTDISFEVFGSASRARLMALKVDHNPNLSYLDLLRVRITL